MQQIARWSCPILLFFFSSRRRHTRCSRDWSSDVCSSDLSLQVLTKYNESPKVINAALCGHENIKPETIEAVLVQAADGVSAARPGARRDVLESYIKRLAKLEEIALSYRGVEMCYAIQAGRELRVMTKADIVSDLDAHQLAKDITKRIEAEMQYPGHIKVVVIRETRAVEVAK